MMGSTSQTEYRKNYTYERPERIFPELKNNLRWDFVCFSPKITNRWLAVEVKLLIRPESRKQLVRWNDVLSDTIRNLSKSLKGTYLVLPSVSLQLTKKQLKILKRAISKAALEKGANLKIREMMDLGPEILAQFPDWPSMPHLEMKPVPRIVRIPKSFYLYKTSGHGCRIEAGSSPPDVFWEYEAVAESIEALNKDDAMLKANAQLGLAKRKGANRTVLLLGCKLPSYNPDLVRGAFMEKIDTKALSNIDSVFVVDLSGKRVDKINFESKTENQG